MVTVKTTTVNAAIQMDTLKYVTTAHALDIYPVTALRVIVTPEGAVAVDVAEAVHRVAAEVEEEEVEAQAHIEVDMTTEEITIFMKWKNLFTTSRNSKPFLYLQSL